MLHAREDYNKHIQDTRDESHRIGENEPVFLIRARDPLAMAAICAYYNAAEREFGHDNPLVLAAALQVARFTMWPEKRLPDMNATDIVPVGDPRSFAGAIKAVNEPPCTGGCCAGGVCSEEPDKASAPCATGECPAPLTNRDQP